MNRRRRRLRRPALLLLAAALLLGGCWDRKEIEDVGFVLAVGLDVGSDDKIAVTVQIAIPRVIAGRTVGGGGGGREAGAPPVVVERLESPTITEALRDLETHTNRRISLVHTKVVIFGRELATRGLNQHLGILTRFREFRRSMMVMLADGTAEEILTVKPGLERDPSLFLENLTRRAFERTARAPRVDLHEFLLPYETLAQEAVLPVVRMHDVSPGLERVPLRKAQLAGTALFRRDKLVGMLEPEETETLLMLTAKMNRFVETIPAPRYPGRTMAVVVSNEGVQTRVNVAGREPSFAVTIKLEGEVREIGGGDVNQITSEGLRELESVLARQLGQKASKLVRRLQEEFEADVLGLGQHLKFRFVDWPSWVKYNWPSHFRKARVTVHVEVYIRRVGMTFQPVRPR